MTLALLLSLGFISTQAVSQELSKDEKKALKKEIKAMQKDPARYKSLKEGIQDKKEQVADLDRQINDLNGSIQATRGKIQEKDRQIKELENEIARMKVEKQELAIAERNQTNLEGLIYKVQVKIDDSAIYREVDQVTGKKRPVFTGETTQDGNKYYTLGFFNNKEEAESFRKYLNILRVKGAQIIAYKDGKPVN